MKTLLDKTSKEMELYYDLCKEEQDDQLVGSGTSCTYESV